MMEWLKCISHNKPSKQQDNKETGGKGKDRSKQKELGKDKAKQKEMAGLCDSSLPKCFKWLK